MGLLVYYSSATGNTHHFVSQLNYALFRIDKHNLIQPVKCPYVLVLPTYADREGKGAVPKAVVAFLNHTQNREWIRGVIGAGNRDFGWTYNLASRVIAQKCGVPCLYRFEMRGTHEDIAHVTHILQHFWKQQDDHASVNG